MDENEEIDLESLVGQHKLSGVDEYAAKFQTYGSHFEDCQCIRFVLDDKTYIAIEDPDDGYRSRMEKLILTDEKITNPFPPIDVVVLWRTQSAYNNDCEILDFIDAKNGKRVLEIGTDNTDDYYPSFVASFAPENMSINEGRG